MVTNPGQQRAVCGQPIVWTPETVAAFWDFWSSQPNRHEDYFAYQVADGVVGFLSYFQGIGGKQVLDFGAGPGYLADALLKRGASVGAVDSSPRSVEYMGQTFAGREGWLGARLGRGGDAWEDASFDLVCCLETIEHVLPEDLNALFHDVLRLLRPGGVALFTTPNAEDIEKNIVFCPQCHSVFHRWQHLRAWTQESLKAKVEKLGYRVIYCAGLNLGNFQAPGDPRTRHLRPRDVPERVKFWLRGLLDRLLPRPFPDGRVFRKLARARGRPHLVALVTRG